MSKTPPVVMVISILGIIYGAITLIATPCSLLVVFGGFMPAEPMMDSLRNDPAYIGITVISVIISTCLGLLLLLSSIASLKLKPWGRTGMMTYAICHIITSTIGTAVSMIYVLPKTAAAMPAAGPGGPMAAKMGMIGGIIGGVLGWLFSVAIACVILYLFTRPRVTDAFKGIFPADPASFPVDYLNQPPHSPPPTGPSA